MDELNDKFKEQIQKVVDDRLAQAQPQIYQNAIIPGQVKPRHLSPGDGTVGNLYYSTGTDFTPVAPGTSGQVLTSNGDGTLDYTTISVTPPAGSITTTMLADAAATSRKVQLQYASAIVATGTQSQATSGATWSDITGATISITPATASVGLVSYYNAFWSSAINGRIDVRILVDAGVVNMGTTAFSGTANQRMPLSLLLPITLTAASHTIKVQMSDQAAGGNTINCEGSNNNGLSCVLFSQ